MLTLGPLTLSFERLLAISAIFIFLMAAGWIGKRQGNRKQCERAAWAGLAFGVLGARLGFVAENWASFSSEPATIFYLWQGGFSVPWGLALGGTTLFLLLRGSEALKSMAALFLVCTLTALTANHLLLAHSRQPFPEGLTIHSMAGEAILLDSYRGKPFVINLWASWCPPCQREMPMLIEEVEAASTPILLVNQGEDRLKVEEWLQRQKLVGANILLDQEQAVSQSIRSTGLPITLFVNADGVVEKLHVGEISRAGLRADMRKSGG